jgi:hypothetical protein
MNNDDFEAWRSFKERALTEINNILSKVEEQPMTGNGSLEEEQKRVDERRQEPQYKEAAKKLRDILQDMCRVYLTATLDQRAGIRALINDRISILFHLRGLQDKASEQLHSPEDLEWLLIGLAAVSLEDRAIDYRDTYPVLAQLYIRAARSGIDPAPYFTQVASISSKERNRLRHPSASELISGFENKESGLYKQLVEPYL